MCSSGILFSPSSVLVEQSAVSGAIASTRGKRWPQDWMPAKVEDIISQSQCFVNIISNFCH